MSRRPPPSAPPYTRNPPSAVGFCVQGGGWVHCRVRRLTDGPSPVVRYVRFSDGSDDTEYWGGYFGAMFRLAYV